MDARAPARRGALLLACFALCLGPAVAGPKSAIADEAAPMYEPDAVVVVDLTLPPASIEALEDEDTWDEYQPGTFSLAFTDGSPDGAELPSAPMEIGVRLKGKFGSFQPLTGKAAFKLKLNFVKGKEFLGLKKMTLNNMVQDPSMLRETLAYEVFRAAGVAAPRTGYAYVRVNGEDYGLYLNVETFDDVSLERWFGAFDDPQHLYEGEYGADVTPEGVEAFEVDEGDEDDRSDLEALAAAVGDEGATFSERMGGRADLEQMTRMWAIEKYTGHWDGYAGTPGPPFPNNYYLLSSASGEFQMLPWGTDQTWIERLEFDSGGGLMFNECLADAACASMYREALLEVQEVVAALDLDSLAQDTADLLMPWQQVEQLDGRPKHDLDEIESWVDATRAFVAARPLDLVEWLAGEPPVQPDEPTLQLPSDSPLPAGPPARPMIRVVRQVATDGVLSTRVQLAQAGQVSQLVEIRTAGGPVRVCAVQARVPEAGAATLRCPLSASARRRIAARWLRLKVRTRFSPVDGAPEFVTRELLAPRDPVD